MKQRITLEQLAQLTESQKHRLSEIWIPEKYDVAVAYICKDVTSEEYEINKFIVGAVDVSCYGGVTLYDLRIVNNIADNEDSHNSQSVQESESFSTEPLINTNSSPYPSWEMADETVDNTQESNNFFDDEPNEESDEGNFDYCLDQPYCFNKEDCLPILSIGQMIDILYRNNFGKYDFYLYAGTYEIGCELGKSGSAWNDCEQAELCDVLWESVKAIL